MKRDQMLRTVDLNRRDIYISPLGRRCILRPQPEGRQQTDLFTFTYVDFPSGFSFTSENIPLLRKAP